jgi:hypothetical protein
MNAPQVRPATSEDLAAFLGGPPPYTCRAIVGELDGVPIGIGGIGYERGRAFVFCDLKPEARQFKRAIVKAALSVLEMSQCRGIKPLAVADPEEPGSVRLLTWLGFRREGTTPGGDLFTL